MTKAPLIAALFVSSTVAATASIQSVSQGPAQASADRQENPAQSLTRRGTRTAPMTINDDRLATWMQPRRGQRPQLPVATLAMSAPVSDGLRRGMR